MPHTDNQPTGGPEFSTTGHSDAVTAGPARSSVHRNRVYGWVQVLVTVGAIVTLLVVIGPDPFVAGLRALTPWSIAVALALGAAGTLIQAQRWRLVSRGYGTVLSLSDAWMRCWQAVFLNSVLPGGLAGDAMRAIEHRVGRDASWRGSVGSVAGERLAGTAVVLVAASVALLGVRPWLSAAAGGAALVVVAFAWPALRRLAARDLVAVGALSVAGWLVFAALFVVAVRSEIVAVTIPAWPDVFGLAAVLLAGMSIPLSWGGWGPREGAAALGFVVFGYTAELGVAVSVGYGLLALISVLPGGLVLLTRSALFAVRGA